MPSPLAALMGFASGAMGLLQRVMGHGNTVQGFEDQLRAALSGGPEGGAALFGQARETLDGELLAAVTATPQAIPLFQFLSALKSMGVGSDDARALLAGTPQGLSDEGLKAILASCGFKDADITQIFADTATVNDLKARLAESISTRLCQQTGAGSVDTGRLITLATTDQATYEAVVAQFIVSRGFRQGVPGTPEKPAIQTTTTPSDITKIVSQIQESVAEVLKPPHAELSEGHHVLFTRPAQAQAAAAGTTGLSSGPAAVPTSPESAVQAAAITASQVTMQPAAATAPEVTAQVAAMVDALEDTFNIPKGLARDLVFATDSQVRHAAVQEATARISSVLSARADTELPRQAVDALGLLKGALSQEEFAGIETTVKTHMPEAAATLAPAVFDRDMIEALARQVSDDAPAMTRQYTREVVDQIRQAVPAYAKTGEGSLTLRLNPPMLGRVDIDIRVEDGQVMASFKVDQSVTRDIIQQNLNVLKDALSEQGIKATQFVVTTDTFGARDHRQALAWLGNEGNRGGSGQQGREQGSRNPGRETGEYGHGYAPAGRFIEAGRLDIIA